MSVLVPVLRKGPDLIDFPNPELRHVVLRFVHPVVYAEACEPRFRGRMGTHDEVGGTRASHSTHPFLPLAYAPMHFHLTEPVLGAPITDVNLFYAPPPPVETTHPEAVAEARRRGWRLDPVPSRLRHRHVSPSQARGGSNNSATFTSRPASAALDADRPPPPQTPAWSRARRGIIR